MHAYQLTARQLVMQLLMNISPSEIKYASLHALCHCPLTNEVCRIFRHERYETLSVTTIVRVS